VFWWGRSSEWSVNIRSRGAGDRELFCIQAKLNDAVG
jgi:hypothetical protein